jgi:creatinine amidohydrolase
LSHACEYETSLMLHLQPGSVHLEHARPAEAPAANDWTGWEDEVPYRGVSLARRTEQISASGASGQPQLATAEKGAHLLASALDALETFARDFHSWPLPEDLHHA